MSVVNALAHGASTTKHAQLTDDKGGAQGSAISEKHIDPRTSPTEDIHP